MKERIKKIPILGPAIRTLYSAIAKKKKFPGSRAYWDQRYQTGGTSGVGSYSKFAEFKAEVINSFVEEQRISTVVEFGCGDGNQLKLARYPSYLGLDVSSTVIASCKRTFSLDRTKAFKELNEYSGENAELALSLDVIYHLIEDDVFRLHMELLFAAATRHVLIYSSNSDDNRGYEGTHVRHRKFTSYVEERFPEWRLIKHIPNRFPYLGDYRVGSFADFYIYARH